MKAKRFLFRAPTIFGTPLKYGAPVFIGFTVLISGLEAQGGDILRGGSPASNKPGRAGANTRTAAATDAARANAKDTLARTTKTLNSIRAMQQAARQTALKNGTNNLGKNPFKPTVNLPNVPNGLVTGGLKISGKVTTDPTQWTGANLPVQETKKNGKTNVTIKQTEQQALLNWETFNVGKKTTVTFDQSKGGEDVGKWIAFNKINDPTGNPTQILGNIKADGQIYLINTNGIIFGGSSQVNARGLTVSSLPINDNLVGQGLLNNRDAQFLFSALAVPGGSDGTPNFDPGPLPVDGYGDIIIREGARLISPDDGAGNGGRIMLVGENVTNLGSISTDFGQTILAAGQQVAIAAHDGNDPSLRGIDVFVGQAEGSTGTVLNRGVVSAATGSIVVSGRELLQEGALLSTTSVALNGRIDVLANYGAVSNPNFDNPGNPGGGGPQFLFQKTGLVSLGKKSVTQILPEYESLAEVPGTELPERSQVNIDGLSVHFDSGSQLFVPSGLVNLRAGTRSYTDSDGNRTIFDLNGETELGLTNHFTGSDQKFLFDRGQIYLDKDATVSVAGSVDVFVSREDTLLTVQLLGPELADSPLQRDSDEVRGTPITVDLRNTGVYGGRFWQGTPLGDVTGLAGLIQRNVAQLTVSGGEVSMRAGESVIVQEGATLNVSGGSYRHESGPLNKSFLISGGQLIPVEQAIPERSYDGVFNGENTIVSPKWGISETYKTPLFQSINQPSFIEGGAGGKLSITAPGMALDGSLVGITIRGDGQRDSPPSPSQLNLSFLAEKILPLPGGQQQSYLDFSPTPPLVEFRTKPPSASVPEFSIVAGEPAPLPTDRLTTVNLSSDLLDEDGFSSISLYNPDGEIVVPKGVKLSAEAGSTIDFSAANLTVHGTLEASSGAINLTTYNISPTSAAEFLILNPPGSVAFPAAVAGRGLFTLGASGSLVTSGRISNDLPGSEGNKFEPISTAGGAIKIHTFTADLAVGSLIDVSGGVHASSNGTFEYGKAGQLEILTGNDFGFPGVLGGGIVLGSELRGYANDGGGKLIIRAGTIAVGNGVDVVDLRVNPTFFSTGGFSNIELQGIGAASLAAPPSDQFEAYVPAIVVESSSDIAPTLTNVRASVDSENGSKLSLKQFKSGDAFRDPVSLTLSANGVDDPATVNSYDVRADIILHEGSQVAVEPGGAVAIKGQTVSLFGSITAPGGSISVNGASSFPFTAEQRQFLTVARPTVHIGKQATLSTVGVFRPTPDLFGRKTGVVLPGGSITVGGNIVAELGSTMDASGASAMVALLPSQVDFKRPLGEYTSGLLTLPVRLQSQFERVDSNGGTISLNGSEMLLSDASLRGAAGGDRAEAGTLSISSFRFYPVTAGTITGADTNLLVYQDQNVVLTASQDIGVGRILKDSLGTEYGNLGEFSLRHFIDGEFANLNLGGNFRETGDVPVGGNVEFRGDINLRVPGSLRLAAGGVVTAEASVKIQAGYMAVGQNFRAPLNPSDEFIPFRQSPATPSPVLPLAPVHGTGNLQFTSRYLDVGVLSLQKIGTAGFDASSGELRGNNAVHIAGDLTIQAGVIYPTSGAKFSLFAYDHAGGEGSISIGAGKTRPTPLSVGGTLEVYATRIEQNGVLRAPGGSIIVGWDGTDTDPSDPDLDSPFDPIARGVIASPSAQQVSLGDQALISVASVSGKGNSRVPYGISPDGRSWIDPRAINVSLNGLPGKQVQISGQALTASTQARVDLRGGGNLIASRWIAGSGGSIDLLGSTTAQWTSGIDYEAGDLVLFGGQTWSARVGNANVSPTISRFWSKLPESYAILPASGLQISPFNSFNTGSNADLLGGDPGYIDSNLSVGDVVKLDGGSGLKAGSYVLLPRRYALLPGAYLATPLSLAGLGATETADGSTQVTGYVENRFSAAKGNPATRIHFEIAPESTYEMRAEYQVFGSNKFIQELAVDAGIPEVQKLPQDAGRALFNGVSQLQFQAEVLTGASGRGSEIDISTLADIKISATDPSTSQAGSVTLSSGRLSSWGAESLLIGGQRRTLADGSVVVDAKTNSITLDHAKNPLEAGEVMLASNTTIDIASGTIVRANSDKTFASKTLAISGQGASLRVSNDSEAILTREFSSNASSGSISIAGNTRLTGSSVILDSTGVMNLSSSIGFKTDRIELRGGGVALLLDDSASGPQLGSSVVLDGATLDNILSSERVAFTSYTTIDMHGSGVLGRSGLDALVLSAGSIRGFEQGDGTASFLAKNVTFQNSAGAIASAPSAGSSGQFAINAGEITFGANSLAISGFNRTDFNATGLIRISDFGSLNVSGEFGTRSESIIADAGANYSILASGAIQLLGNGNAVSESGALGGSISLVGSSIMADGNILMPSGLVTMRATQGDLNISGFVSVEGTAKHFNKLVRYANGGQIELSADQGDVLVGTLGEISVDASDEGGNAGLINVENPNGAFLNFGRISGHANVDFESGSFVLDTGSLQATGAGSLSSLIESFNKGGLSSELEIRVRNGDVMIDHAIKARDFALFADGGSIQMSGIINASGETGGSVHLAARDNLILQNGAAITAAARVFDNAGKGGTVVLEAGSQQNGIVNQSALLNLETGSSIDLSVNAYASGSYLEPGSSAFEGKFTGTLHLRAPRNATNTDLGIASLAGSIVGASSIVAEGYKIYAPANGVMNTALRSSIDNDNRAFLGSNGSTLGNDGAIRTRLLSGSPNSAMIDSLLVVAPGVEIHNRNGDLTLGLANNSSNGSTSAEARHTADWDLSTFRYGEKGAPGILTLRSGGDIVFNNTLSDGFTPVQLGALLTLPNAGDSLMWLATVNEVNPLLPTNAQSWSYRITAGADFGSSDYGATRSFETLAGKGSVLVGEFYPAVPNNRSTGSAAGIGLNGLTSNTIKISSTNTDRGTRFEVVRTGTGSISVNAARDVQLRNQFSTIYTAGVALGDPTRVFTASDFVTPVVPEFGVFHPPQSGLGGVNLGAVQQLYQPVWTLAGGNLSLNAGRDIGRFTFLNGAVVADSSRQLPTNWLYRRGFVDPSTGVFSNQGGFGTEPGTQNLTNIHDTAVSTAWWVDFSNFFQGFGTLGGGNVELAAGNDLVNADAVAPTNARMVGQMKNPAYTPGSGIPEFITVAPDATKLLEYGGGDVTAVSGRNIDGGVFYVERGLGTLTAGGSITTNAARTPSRGILVNEAPLDSRTWLPTTLFVGKATFNVTAANDVLLGPISNPFLLPQGINNRFWYKTYFNTFSPEAGATITSYGGDVTLRNASSRSLGGSTSVLGDWYNSQNLFTGAGSTQRSSNYQPWLRLVETSLSTFNEVFELYAPNLESTSFAGSVRLVGDITLAPSPTGDLEIAAAQGIIGLNDAGTALVQGVKTTLYTYSSVNVSDASPESIPGITNPLAYQQEVGSDRVKLVTSNVDILRSVGQALTETGSYTGSSASALVKRGLHGEGILHLNDKNPVSLNALGGDITGLQLFTPKKTEIYAEQDITDVAFYLQNTNENDISVVSSGRDLIPYNEGSQQRILADNFDAGNIIADSDVTTQAGTPTNARAGDIQISGPGVLEVLAGADLDLGTGANFFNGTGTGITSIGNSRNLNLPFTGADLIVLGGIVAPDGIGPAGGLASSNLDFQTFLQDFVDDPDELKSNYLRKLRMNGNYSSVTEEQQAIALLEEFFNQLRDSGREAGQSGDYSGGFDAIAALFGKTPLKGGVDLRAREIRTVTGGAISVSAAGGDIFMASEVFGNPLTPPGIVTEFGGEISTLTDGDVDIGQSRIFTLRGGDIVMWSSNGNIAAGSAPRTVVTAPPTRVLVDINSAAIQTDLGGLATGGGIGVLASVEGVEPGDVDLIAPNGFVDAGDAGIRVTGNLNIAAQLVLNSSNISVAGNTSGSAVSAAGAPSVAAVTSASNASVATTTTVTRPNEEQKPTEVTATDLDVPSIYSVEVIGYGDDSAPVADDEKEDENNNDNQTEE